MRPCTSEPACASGGAALCCARRSARADVCVCVRESVWWASCYVTPSNTLVGGRRLTGVALRVEGCGAV